MPSIKLDKAATLSIRNHPYPVITAYELGLNLFQMIVNGKIEDQPLLLQTRTPERRHYRQAVNFLLSYGVLREIRGTTSESVFSILGKDNDAPAEQIVCRIDPFSYLSHLSAMEFHGLTDRISQTVYASSPSQKEWKDFARYRMEKDLGILEDDYLNSDFPRLVRFRMSKIRSRSINIFARQHLGAFRTIRSTGMRVSTIGRTFLDMLREPDLCGGIHHVLTVYRESANAHLQLIINDIDAHGTAIDKVRAGYVLSELVGADHPAIRSWKRFAQRGGSRKLYAKNEYSTKYSEEWCLSLNAD